MSGRINGRVARYLLGTCIPSSKENAAKIRVKTTEFDENIMMHHNKYECFYASDPQKKCKPGDTVLIQNLPTKLTKLITHRIVDIVYPLGDITDPITGKKIVASKYRDEVKETNIMYGERDNAFDYDKAPPRGVMEGKRDFSHKKTYVKYHEDPNGPQDPFAV